MTLSVHYESKWTLSPHRQTANRRPSPDAYAVNPATLLGTPPANRLLRDPEPHISATAQGCVVARPVGVPVPNVLRVPLSKRLKLMHKFCAVWDKPWKHRHLTFSGF